MKSEVLKKLEPKVCFPRVQGGKVDFVQFKMLKEQNLTYIVI
jgi:hypothetical protein